MSVDNFDESLSIIEITSDNIKETWPVLTSAIQKASFIALDCELSGLGNRSKLNYPEVDIRYKYTAEIAQNFSVVSLGISCFSCDSVQEVELDTTPGSNTVRSQSYLVQTFNILTLKEGPFSVEASSLKFLLSHGFDFNRQYSKGVLYKSGNDKQPSFEPGVRAILSMILVYEKPIITHNGFVDLAFIYESFYCSLPSSIGTYSADLAEMFAGGVYDTKYIAEYYYASEMPATYLLYIFKKLQVQNYSRQLSGKWHVHLHFPPYPSSFLAVRNISYQEILQFQKNSSQKDKRQLCENYKFHGWCPKGTECLYSHSVNRMVMELRPVVKKRKKPCGVASGSVIDAIRYKVSRNQSQKMVKQNREVSEKEKISNTISSPRSVSDLDINEDDMQDSEGSETPVKNGSEGEKSLISVQSTNVNRKSNSSSSADILNEREGLERQKVGNNLNIQNGIIDISPSNTISKTLSNGQQENINECHSAGFDAFMTGYIFCCAISSQGNLTEVKKFSSCDIGMDHIKNKVYLIGKEIPFLVQKGTYSETSTQHTKMMKLTKGIS